MAFFERSNMLTTQDILIADVTRHYTLQAIKQFYVVVLGLDVLGNPYGLITEYGKGFKDLFYEPYLVTSFFIFSYYVILMLFSGKTRSIVRKAIFLLFSVLILGS